MQTHTVSGEGYVSSHGASSSHDGQRSGVSWGAIFAGATAAAALSLILYLLGTGLGFASASPWEHNSGVAFGIAAILWLSFTQLAASAVGGYLAGRLRVRWAGIHANEVYFRDTAHGLLAWAVATLVTVVLLTGAMGKMAGAVVDAGAGVAKAGLATGAAAAAGAANGAANAADNGASANPLDYFSDMLLRSDKPGGSDDASLRQESLRIFANSLQNGALAADDRAYLVRRIAERNGIDPGLAEKRVDEVYARGAAAIAKAKLVAKEAADTARKVAAITALWLTVALLVGAFVASWCATLGGKLRDGIAGASHR